MHTKPGFELHGLQKLFATAVTGVDDSTRLLFNPDLIREYVIGEVAGVKHRFLEKVVAIGDDDAVRRYVRIHQYALVGMMDKLFERWSLPHAFPCHEILEGLLLFLKQHFSGYFDEAAKAPAMDIHAARIDIGVLYPLLERDLLRIADFPSFVYMILDPLERFCSRPNSQIPSFHRVRHIRYILEHAQKVCKEGRQGDHDEPLIRLLLYLNYNSRKTFAQFTQFLRGLIPLDLGTSEQLAILDFYLKVASQATVKAESGYHPNAPTLKSQLIDYVEAELRYVNNIKKEEDAQAGLSVQEKVKLNITVAQLACLLRVCADVGFVSTDNTSQLIRILARNCETVKAGQISERSLRTKFYDIKPGTKRAVRQMLGEFWKKVLRFFEEGSSSG